MKKGTLLFWVSCPDCKRKFGIEPKYIFKYIDRMIDHEKHRIDGVEDLLTAVQDELGEANGQRSQN
jgi:hypothetical protein